MTKTYEEQSERGRAEWREGKEGGQRVRGVGEGKEERERRERPLAGILLVYLIF